MQLSVCKEELSEQIAVRQSFGQGLLVDGCCDEQPPYNNMGV